MLNFCCHSKIKPYITCESNIGYEFPRNSWGSVLYGEYLIIGSKENELCPNVNWILVLHCIGSLLLHTRFFFPLSNNFFFFFKLGQNSIFPVYLPLCQISFRIYSFFLWFGVWAHFRVWDIFNTDSYFGQFWFNYLD